MIPSICPRGPLSWGWLCDLDRCRRVQAGRDEFGLRGFGNQNRTSPTDQCERDERADDNAIHDEQSRGLATPVGNVGIILGGHRRLLLYRSRRRDLHTLLQTIAKRYHLLGVYFVQVNGNRHKIPLNRRQFRLLQNFIADAECGAITPIIFSCAEH